MLTTRKLLVLALLLALILSACGGNTSPTATTAPTDVPPTVEATNVPTDVPTEEATEEVSEEAVSEGGAATTEGAVVTITQIDTSLRSGPGTAYAVAARATVNDSFPAVGRYGEGRTLWYQITLPDGSLAWAWSRVSELSPADTELPVVEEIPPTPSS
ncbi:MAG: hypothetical protein IAE80_20860 [Anaerolinea sp.]|nr:hypothetical protein [Anaerolinea sp.]